MYFGKVSVIIGNKATVKLEAEGTITGQLYIPKHITTLTIGDTVLCGFISNDFQQGMIIGVIQ